MTHLSQAEYAVVFENLLELLMMKHSFWTMTQIRKRAKV